MAAAGAPEIRRKDERTLAEQNLDTHEMLPEVVLLLPLVSTNTIVVAAGALLGFSHDRRCTSAE